MATNNLRAVLTPVSKSNFKKWYSEGALLLLNGGNAVLDDVLKQLYDHTIDWSAGGTPVTGYTVDGKQYSVQMYSNGVDVFIIVIDDMSASDYMRRYYFDTGKQHLTIYVCKPIQEVK